MSTNLKQETFRTRRDTSTLLRLVADLLMTFCTVHVLKVKRASPTNAYWLPVALPRLFINLSRTTIFTVPMMWSVSVRRRV